MRKYLLSGFVLTTLLTLRPAHALAQQPPAGGAAPVEGTTTLGAILDQGRAQVQQAQRDPLVRSSLALPEPQLTLDTTRGNGRATASIGLVKPQPGGEVTLGLAVSSPIGSRDDAEARPVDLRGLSDGAIVAFSIGGSNLFKSFSVNSVVQLCKKQNISTENCTAGKLEDAAPELSRALLAEVFRAVPVLYSLSVSYGRNKFTFFDAAGAIQAPVRHNDVQAEGAVGFMVRQRRDLLAFQATYSNAFTASSNRTQLCRPLSGSIVSQCDTATIGGPTQERLTIATVEYRLQLATTRVPIAFAPKFQYAFNLDGADDLQSIEAPFYFFQAKPDPKAASTAPKLNGGISTGWRSDSGFQVGVFIGTTFNLFKL